MPSAVLLIQLSVFHRSGAGTSLAPQDTLFRHMQVELTDCNEAIADDDLEASGQKWHDSIEKQYPKLLKSKGKL